MALPADIENRGLDGCAMVVFKILVN